MFATHVMKITAFEFEIKGHIRYIFSLWDIKGQGLNDNTSSLNDVYGKSHIFSIR